MLANCESRPALDSFTSIYTFPCSTRILKSTTGAHPFPGHSLLFFIFSWISWLIFFCFYLNFGKYHRRTFYFLVILSYFSISWISWLILSFISILILESTTGAHFCSGHSLLFFILMDFFCLDWLIFPILIFNF